jgi:hypothetical protein
MQRFLLKPECLGKLFQIISHNSFAKRAQDFLQWPFGLLPALLHKSVKGIHVVNPA